MVESRGALRKGRKVILVFPMPVKVIRERLRRFSADDLVLIVVLFLSVDSETALYTELWHACAGPLVTVPRERERVFYFPQGHIEQVSSFFTPIFSSISFVFSIYCCDFFCNLAIFHFHFC